MIAETSSSRPASDSTSVASAIVAGRSTAKRSITSWGNSAAISGGSAAGNGCGGKTTDPATNPSRQGNANCVSAGASTATPGTRAGPTNGPVGVGVGAAVSAGAVFATESVGTVGSALTSRSGSSDWPSDVNATAPPTTSATTPSPAPTRLRRRRRRTMPWTSARAASRSPTSIVDAASTRPERMSSGSAMVVLHQCGELGEGPAEPALHGAGCDVECRRQLRLGPVEVVLADHHRAMVDRELTECFDQRRVTGGHAGRRAVDDQPDPLPAGLASPRSSPS